MQHIEFTGRKPSKAQIFAKLKPLLKTWETFILIQWGENQITLERFGAHDQWLGSGWIKSLSGDDIAKELNNQLKAKQAFNFMLGNPMQAVKNLTIRG